MDQPEYIVGLLRKYLDGTLNGQEALALQEWANAQPENKLLMARLAQDDLLRADILLYWDLWNNTEAADRERRILNSVNRKTATGGRSPRRRLRKWMPYVAALLLALVVGRYVTREQRQAPEAALSAEDILPGGNRATLTLADGSTIDLNASQSGIVIGNDITYLDGSAVNKALAHTASETLVLRTPVGGNYSVILPDGSRVWLNASSTLTYPSRFEAGERVVQLEGEAYFQIEQQRVAGRNIPFKVVSNGQTVHVRGTEFNISAYADELQTKTTLVHGAIEVTNLASNNTHKITPGQQAVLQGTQVEVQKADISKSIAWKNGRFSFDGKSFEQIMREMARWYNLTVQYEGSIPNDQFIGDAFKTDKLGTVLRFLESSDIQYRVEPGLNRTYRLIINNAGRKEARR